MNAPEAVIATLENAPAIIVPLVREAVPAILKRRPEPDQWSMHEHACHLAAVHPIFFSRLDTLLSDPSPRITPYLPSAEDEAGALLAVDLDGALDRFVQDRRRLVERLKELSPEDWQRYAEHEEYSHYSTLIMFRHLALHDMMHGYHIEELLLNKEWTLERT